MPLLVQVKGYINEMAARLEDEDDRISSLAKLFFNELSKKVKYGIHVIKCIIIMKIYMVTPF